MRGGRVFLRDLRPDVRCAFCQKPATWLCIECAYEEEADNGFCDRHIRSHDHDPAYFAMLVNSPRVGVCGMIESAEPPY